MKLVKSQQIEEYIKNNKKEAENIFPYIIKKLVNNTVKNITCMQIPNGDNTIQTGLDGIIKFQGTDKFLGDRPANIEIGTDEKYLTKANEDIKKRKNEANPNENFIFITPYRWNSRKMSKSKWISNNKKIYNWNDIKIIDAAVLEDWLEDDILTSKYILKNLNIQSEDIYSIQEKEQEYMNKSIKKIGLDFFDYEDKEYEVLLKELKKDFYNIVAPTREEGIYVTLFYLKKLNNEENVLVIENEKTWKSLIDNNCLNNCILIPNFYHNDSLEVPKNNVTIFISDSEEFIATSDYSIKQRTINNLNNKLELYYKKDNDKVDYEQIHLIINNSLGKYMPLKRVLFKELNAPNWYNDKEDIQMYIYIFFMNNFKSYDLKLFEEFGISKNKIKAFLNKKIKEKDPFVIYYMYRDEYICVNLYNIIEWIGNFIDENTIDILCNISKKILFYIDPKYLPNNINKPYYFDENDKREYSKNIKKGLLKSLIITKLYLEKKNKNRLMYQLNNLIDNYYNSITTTEQYYDFANISNEIVEFNYEKFLLKIKNSINNVNFIKIFNLENKDPLFSSNEYCNILWGIEKAVSKKGYITEAINILVQLCEMKNTNYKNMANTPFNTLKYIFLGWDNLTCLNIDEKIFILKKIVKEHNEIGKKLIKAILPNNSCSWAPLQKPEFDSYDEVKTLKYIREQKEYFEEYYQIYINNYAKTIKDLVCIYEELYFIEFDCFELIKNKTLELLDNSSDDEKYELKEKISERIRGYRKFNNSAWNLTNEQLQYLEFINNSIIYQNEIYNYIYIYNSYRIFINKDELLQETIKAMNLIIKNSSYEDFLLKKCLNKRRLIEDIYMYIHKNKHNINFLKKLFIEYNDCVDAYLRCIYINEDKNEILKIYDNEYLADLPDENKVFILSNAGYQKKLYAKIKNTNLESLYWNNLNIYNGEQNDFVYECSFKYGNIENCLIMLYDKEGKENKKLELLEKIKTTGYKNSQIRNYEIEKIFESFHDYENEEILEKLAKLEIYYSPILERDSYFISKVASKYPNIVAELAILIFKDEDGNLFEISNRDIVVSNCFDKLHKLRIEFDENGIEWCNTFITIMRQNKRSQVMYHVLGQILARTGIDDNDKMFPPINVRKIIEHFYTPELANSFKIEKYNERGVHFIGIGKEEFEIYKKYFDWSNKMSIQYPKTSKILKELAETYKKESDEIRDEANYV